MNLVWDAILKVVETWAGHILGDHPPQTSHKVGVNFFNKMSSKSSKTKDFWNKYWHLSSFPPGDIENFLPSFVFNKLIYFKLMPTSRAVCGWSLTSNQNQGSYPETSDSHLKWMSLVLIGHMPVEVILLDENFTL